VRHLFDQFSADYDNRMMGQLDYAAPRILKDLADLVMPGRDRLSVLDLGCGTGLAGMVFKSRAARLDGIDLSPAMIGKARARGIYDSLAVGDIETALRGRYDLIMAADTLVYLGDLTLPVQNRRGPPVGEGFFPVHRRSERGRRLRTRPQASLASQRGLSAGNGGRGGVFRGRTGGGIAPHRIPSAGSGFAVALTGT